MAVGGRYDLEAVRRAAAEAKRKARVKAWVSNCTAVAVVAALVVGAKIGWDKWQAHREEERKAAQAAAAKEEYERQLSEKREAEKREAARERQEKQRLEREAEEARRRKAKEDEIRMREEARVREADEREAARVREKEEREWQAANKGYVDRVVAALRFSVSDYLVVDAESDAGVEASVDGERWANLSALAASRSTIEFLDAVNVAGSVTNAYSESHYPDRATLRELLDVLDGEKFVMVVRLHRDRLQNQKLVLAVPDLVDGLVIPAGARTMKGASGRVDGWTVPFVFKRSWPMFVMRQQAVEGFKRDWRSTRRRVLKEAEKLADRDAFVEARLKSEMDASVDALKIDVTTLRVQEAPAKTDADKRKTESRPSLQMKGMNRDLRSFR